MRAERLFRVLGLADPALVEEALEVRRRRPWKRWAAMAACLALAAGLGFGWLASGGFRGYGGMAPEADSGNSGGPSADPGAAGDGLAFLSYAGPVLPLDTLENPAGLTAEREVAWDFAPGANRYGERRQWGADVTDAYILRNGTEEDVTVTALYPFAGNFDSLPEIRPAVAVDGEAVEPELYAGAYAGGFQPAFGAEVPDTLNLEGLDSWEKYKALLESGTYRDQALGEYPALDIPVTVYEFSEFAAPHGDYPAATQAVSFDMDPERTAVLTYGFNGMDWEGSFRRYSFFVPDGKRKEPDGKLLAVLGEDIGEYTLAGYQNGGCHPGEEIAGVSCAVTRSVTTLDALLDRLCRDYAERYAQERAGQENAFDTVPLALYRRAVAELLVQYGALSGAPKDRYAEGRLDDMLQEAVVHQRVLYLRFPVTVPAGGSAEVACTLWKEPSYDFGCSGLEDEGLQGYSLAVRLGSGLAFTRQGAVLANTENVEITGQDFGFGLESGMASVELDLEREHYYLEIRPGKEWLLG